MALAALLCLASCSDDDSGIQLTEDEVIGDIITGKQTVINTLTTYTDGGCKVNVNGAKGKVSMQEMFPEYEAKRKRALEISIWNIPPHHIKRQVVSMMHTPTGKTAFDNKKFFPIKENGIPVKGYRNTYKRQNWDTPAYTVTMDNRKISSQNNVHPGRYLGKDQNGDDLYSDARTLTLYERPCGRTTCPSCR